MPLIDSLTLENFAAFDKMQWNNLGALNLIIGLNDTGKTHLLKVMYALTRSIEEYWRAENSPSRSELPEVLSRKLLWTFLPEPQALGQLVQRGQTQAKVRVNFDKGSYCHIDLGEQSESRLLAAHVQCHNLERFKEKLRATYIPPKEILSLFKAIKSTVENVESIIPAFEATYSDLLNDYRAIEYETQGDNALRESIRALREATGQGDVLYNANDDSVSFRKPREVSGRKNKMNDTFSIFQTAEGIKKISVLERLCSNRRLQANKACILFVDEPETSLHPQAIIQFAEVLHDLAQKGIQVFVATHSYYFMKRMEQLARKSATDYQLLDLRRDQSHKLVVQQQLLRDGIGDSPIVEQSLWLYDRDIEMALS